MQKHPRFSAVSGLLLVSYFAIPLQAAPASLIEAAKTEDVATARALIQNKADVNATAVDGTTPLHWAVRAENTEMLDLLLKAKANEVADISNADELPEHRKGKKPRKSSDAKRELPSSEAENNHVGAA